MRGYSGHTSMRGYSGHTCKILMSTIFALSQIIWAEPCVERHFCSCPPFLPVNSAKSETELRFTKHTYADHFAIVGKSKELHCCVAPAYTSLEWSKDDVVFPWDQNRNAILYSLNQSLILLDVKAEDHGLYRCTATKAADGAEDSISHTASLQSFPTPVFSHPPIWNMEPRDAVVARGEKATLACSATVGQQYNMVSMEPGHASWMRFGQEVESGQGKTLTQRWTDDDIVTHLILEITSAMESDSGNYSCRVVNNYGVLEKTVSLEVAPVPLPGGQEGDNKSQAEVTREVKAALKKQMKIFRSMSKIAALEPAFFLTAIKEVEKKIH